ncbi:Fur family transcriptional regulator [Sphingopyxis panaciterrulae]|uniref:Fur family zinc uptake transcriptional regulator n=1 Tax=Sphingopyxis panaciterrulae TaxID=462372 RepID=A0A7W9EPE4_9SPHN|nr:transcriptional repressor [Sphingopyxis panaciterrulae]MBB5705359.1 Fur family zinc uptake transcriptional regulator [Sphingopyxis panaciterrulae]
MGKHEHKHIEASGASLARAAQGALEQAGEAWTDMRAQIFDAVAEIGKPASAYEIADIVSRKRGKRVAPNSVYRILDLFVANNLVRRVESANAFVANSHPGCLHDCIFLICDSCGNAVHVDNDLLSDGVRAAAEAAGFAAERPVIEVRGKCPECQ